MASLPPPAYEAETETETAPPPAPGYKSPPDQTYAPAPGYAAPPAPGYATPPAQSYAPALGYAAPPAQSYAPAPGYAAPPAQGYAPAPAPQYAPQPMYAAPGPQYVTAPVAGGYPAAGPPAGYVVQPVVYGGVMVFGHFPVQCQCPHCGYRGVSIVQHQPSCLTWTLCILLSGTVCCFLPFCIDSSQAAVHTCGSCRRTIAVADSC